MYTLHELACSDVHVALRWNLVVCSNIKFAWFASDASVATLGLLSALCASGSSKSAGWLAVFRISLLVEVAYIVYRVQRQSVIF